MSRIVHSGFFSRMLMQSISIVTKSTKRRYSGPAKEVQFSKYEVMNLLRVDKASCGDYHDFARKLSSSIGSVAWICPERITVQPKTADSESLEERCLPFQQLGRLSGSLQDLKGLSYWKETKGVQNRIVRAAFMDLHNFCCSFPVPSLKV